MDSYAYRRVKPEHRVHVARLLREYRRLSRAFDSVCFGSGNYLPAVCDALNSGLKLVGRALDDCGVS